MPDLPLIGKWADNFNMDDYMDWFDKININTLIWQVIVVVFLWQFRKEIRKFVFLIIEKIPHIKYVGFTGVHLSEETKEFVEEKSKQLDKQLKPYKDAASKDPSITFLTIFIDVEVLLRKLHSLYFNDSVRHTSNPHYLVNDLFAKGAFSRKLVNDFKIALTLRNKIVHGEKIPNEPYEIDLFSKTLLLLKDEITNVIRREEAKKEQ